MSDIVRTMAAAPRRRAHDVDSLIRRLVQPDSHVAILAVGGYGRGRLAPKSDIDLLVLVRPRTDGGGAFLRSLLYPLWDAGYRIGHSVRTPKETIEFARRDPHTLTGILTARRICGSEDLYDELVHRRDRWVSGDIKKIVRTILRGTDERRDHTSRAGWSLAPDIKEAAGGLRDLNTIEWLQALNSGAHVRLEALRAGELLLAVREALHEVTGRRTDVLHIELQTAVAERLGFKAADVDEFMTQVHFAARRIEHDTSIALATTAARILGGPRRSGAASHVAQGVALADGELTLTYGRNDVDLPAALRLVACASHTGRPIAINQYGALERAFKNAPKWTDEARSEWLHLLSGRNVASVLELLDNLGALTTLLPEWEAIRARAQHDPYHRYTVDGHSFLAVAEVTNAISFDPIVHNASIELGDLTTLYLAALLHDMGKGSGEDHSIAGERLARSVCKRIGVDFSGCEEVASLVRLHLLLPDTATRRDLDDGSVIEEVAKLVGDVRRLKLLYVLAVADGRATGPQAWSEWKASLVAELYRKVLIALETGDLPARSDAASRAREVEAVEPALTGRAEALLATLPPSYLASATPSEIADELLMLNEPLEEGRVRLRVEPAQADRSLVTLVARDRPGTLAKTAGILSLHRVSVLKAQAYSTSTGLALERFVVRAPTTEAWNGLDDDIAAAFAGRLALDARLRQKAKDYRPSHMLDVDVRILNDVSEHSTLIEVRTHDALGLLYCIATALTELDADIHVAKIDTLGERVVDVFYVRTPWGAKLDREQSIEVERAIRHRIAQTIG